MARHEIVIHENTGATKEVAPYLGSYIAKETLQIPAFAAAIGAKCGLSAIHVIAILTGSFEGAGLDAWNSETGRIEAKNDDWEEPEYRRLAHPGHFRFFKVTEEFRCGANPPGELRRLGGTPRPTMPYLQRTSVVPVQSPNPPIPQSTNPPILQSTNPPIPQLMV